MLVRMTDVAAIFGERILTARLAAGVTQRGLAERIGRSQQWVSAVESGHLAPRDGERLSIAAALDADVNELFAYPVAS